MVATFLAETMIVAGYFERALPIAEANVARVAAFGHGTVGHVLTLYYLGRAYLGLRRREPALQAFDEAIEMQRARQPSSWMLKEFGEYRQRAEQLPEE
jgi:hypothetical protein